MLMPHTKLPVKPALNSVRYLLLLPVLSMVCSIATAQSMRLRKSNAWNEASIYSNDTITHTVWKPILFTDTLIGKNTNEKWFKRKFFQEHLLQVEDGDINLYGDIVVDEYIGHSNRYDKFIDTKEVN